MIRCFILVLLLFPSLSIAQYWKVDSVIYKGEQYYVYPEQKRDDVWEDIFTMWKTSESFYVRGLPREGNWIQFFKNDTLQPGYIWGYKNGERHGELTSFYSNGTIEEHGFYVDGKKKGRWMKYFKNGQIQCDSHYENGDLVGHWKCWDAEGRISKEAIEDTIIVDFFPNGRKERENIFCENGQIITEWYRNGQLKNSTTYIYGIGDKDTIQTCFYENGQIKWQGASKNGAWFGPWKFFYGNGKVKAEGSFSEYETLSNGVAPRITHLPYKTGFWSYYYDTGKLMAKGSYKSMLDESQLAELDMEGIKFIKNNDWKYYDELGKQTRIERTEPNLFDEE